MPLSVPPSYPWLPAPSGMYLPALYPIAFWDAELYSGVGGLGSPPPADTTVIVAYVDMGSYFLKVWQLASEV